MTEDLQPATTPDVNYIDPADYPPPINRKLLLLTDTGCAVIGRWEPSGYIGWLPLPQATTSMKRRIAVRGFSSCA